MRIDILTLFPDFFEQFLKTSVIGRAIAKEIVNVNIINIRDYSQDKNKRVDDYPFGGGNGLIMKCQPIVSALNAIKTKDAKVFLLSAQGEVYKQKKAKEFTKIEHLILICGHYEGVDARILDYIDGEISIGDFILTGGEIPAMLIADSIIRLLEGSINKDSLVEESFEDNLLEYPQYSQPRNFDGKKVPDILFSGNHKAIKIWRGKQKIINTLKKRPDLFSYENLSDEMKNIYAQLDDDSIENQAIEDAKKFMK